MKRVLFVLLSFSIGLMAIGADITTGLVAHYEFDGNTNDSSVSNFNLVTNGTKNYGTGKIVQAYSFNGTDNNLTAYATGLNSDTGTLAYWIKTSSNTKRALLAIGDTNVSVSTEINGSSFIVNGIYAKQFSTTVDINDSTWHHVAVTFASVNTTNVYIDGVLSSTDTALNDDLNLSGNIYLGHLQGNYQYADMLDDVRIYNRVLTATDVTELYNYQPPKLSLKAHGGVPQFDGSSSFIKANPIDVGSSATLEAWVNPSVLNASSSFQSIIRQVDISGTTSVLLMFNNDTINMQVNGTSAVMSTYTLDPSIYLNSWNHYAGVYDGTDIKLYVNGELKQTTTAILGNVYYDATGSLNIGAHVFNGTSKQYLNGSVDEVRVWNSPRTQAQIQETMNHQLEGNETGLVTYYNFDERVGNNVVDVAGGDSNGTIEGNVTRLNFLWDCLDFNGTSDYISIPNNASYNLDYNATNAGITFNAWIETNATSGTIFDKAGISTGEFSYSIQVETGGNFALSLKDNSGGLDVAYGNKIINDGKWHYISAVISNSNIFLYVDSVLDANHTITTFTSATISTSSAYIGVDSTLSTYFKGNLAELALYKKALHQNDINKTMHSSLRGNETGLVGYWPLNEGTGLITYDRSLNTNDGTIAGATWIDSAPKILGDKLYTTGKLTTFNKLTLENNITIPTYAWDGAIPSSIDFNSAFGTFAHTATDINESFAISANNDYNVTVRTINYPNVAFVYLNLNLSNILLTDHNITNIQVIGEDGNTENFNILDVVNIIDGANSYTVPIFNPDNNFSIKIDVNDTSFSQSYYYNFVDKHLYGSQDYNLSSDFKQEISLINSNFTIDANLSNYIADLDFHVDFSGSSTALAYSTLQGWISGNTKQFIENLPQQIATSIGSLAYDFNTTVKQYYKDQLVTLRLVSWIGANNSVIETTLLQEYDASRNIGPTTVTANLIDLNVSINEIGPISHILLYDPNGDLKAHVMLQEEFNTSSINFNIPVISGDYSIQAIYRDGNVSSYDNITSQWVDSSIANPVFTIAADLILPVLDSSFNSLLIATTPPLSSFYAQNIYLIKNFEDLNLTFSVYDINGSDINISVEYNNSIVDINTSFSPLPYVTQADYDTSYLTVKSIADVVGTTPVKIIFTNTNLLSTFIEFNVTVAPYGTKVNAGWNLLSLPVSIDLNKTDLKDTFAHNMYIERLYKYNGRWSYWDSIVGYDTSINMNKFSSLHSTEGFWLNSMADTNVVYNFEANLTDINSSLNVYHSGWYLMGFNRDYNITDIPTIVAENNITGIDSVDYIYRYEYLNYTSHWEVYSPNADLLKSVDSIIERTEDNISRYEGVWVYVRKVF